MKKYLSLMLPLTMVSHALSAGTLASNSARKIMADTISKFVAGTEDLPMTEEQRRNACRDRVCEESGTHVWRSVTAEYIRAHRSEIHLKAWEKAEIERDAVEYVKSGIQLSPDEVAGFADRDSVERHIRDDWWETQKAYAAYANASKDVKYFEFFFSERLQRKAINAAVRKKIEQILMARELAKPENQAAIRARIHEVTETKIAYRVAYKYVKAIDVETERRISALVEKRLAEDAEISLEPPVEKLERFWDAAYFESFESRNGVMMPRAEVENAPPEKKSLRERLRWAFYPRVAPPACANTSEIPLSALAANQQDHSSSLFPAMSRISETGRLELATDRNSSAILPISRAFVDEPNSRSRSAAAKHQKHHLNKPRLSDLVKASSVGRGLAAALGYDVKNDHILMNNFSRAVATV